MFLTETSCDNNYYDMQPGNPLSCDNMGSDCGIDQLGQRLVHLHED